MMPPSVETVGSGVDGLKQNSKACSEQRRWPDGRMVQKKESAPKREEGRAQRRARKTGTSTIKMRGSKDAMVRSQTRKDGTEVQHARTVKHETATFPRPVLMLVAIFLKLYVADISG